jgi:hypothetical protein
VSASRGQYYKPGSQEPGFFLLNLRDRHPCVGAIALIAVELRALGEPRRITAMQAASFEAPPRSATPPAMRAIAVTRE